MNAWITIFSTPKPFTRSHVALIQTNALNSWRHLGNAVDVLLIGEEEGVCDVVGKAGVRLISDVRRNQQGTPLVSSIFQIAHDNSSSDLLAYVNADILLTSDFVTVAKAVQEQAEKFLVIGRRWDLDMTKPIDYSGKWEEYLERMVRQKGRLHPTGGSDYFIYPRGCFQQIPDLVIGRAGWDNWMIYEARRKGWHVVDATPSYKVIHQQHDYAHLPGGKPHHRLPESDHNVRLAGGWHAIYTLADANWTLVDMQLEKAAPTWRRIWREMEILPAVSLDCIWLARVFHALFHPVRAYRLARVWFSKTRRRILAAWQLW